MDFVFEIVDKTERKIRLTDKQWKHITSQSSPHAYMTNFLEETKETLIKPEKIISSIYDDYKASYYKYYKAQERILRVIVRYLNGEGFVVTAYFVGRIAK